MHFVKGDFIVDERYIAAKYIRTYNGARILNTSLYDYRVSRLDSFPWFDVVELTNFPVHGLTYDLEAIMHLPDSQAIAYGFTQYRIVKGNALGQGKSGAYSPSIDQTSLHDGGIEMIKQSDAENPIFNYSYEKLDTAIMKLHGDFRINTTLREFFPGKFTWTDTNAMTFAVLTNLKFTHEGTLFITPYSDSIQRLYKSTDNGYTWTQLLAVKTKYPLQTELDSQNEIYAFSGSNIYITKNGGVSWTSLTMQGYRILNFEVLNDTSGFILGACDTSLTLFRCNLSSLKTLKILDGRVASIPYFQKFRRNHSALFIDGNKVIISRGSSFLISEDCGMTWHIVDNPCTILILNSTIQTAYRNKRSTIPLEPGYGYFNIYYPRCGIEYIIKDCTVTDQASLEFMGYYNKDGVGAPHILGVINFHNLK